MIAGYKTVGLELEDAVRKVFEPSLSTCLHDKHQPITDHFDYHWVPWWKGAHNETIHFKQRALEIDVEEGSIAMSYEVFIPGFEEWICGNRSVPHRPYNPYFYGHNQNMVSYDFYENVLRFAIAERMLNTDLTHDKWGSRMFQFFVGDLYEVFPRLRSKYYASQAVTGNCRAMLKPLSIYKADWDAFNVSMGFKCELNINREKITDFQVHLVGEVDALPKAESSISTAANNRLRLRPNLSLNQPDSPEPNTAPNKPELTKKPSIAGDRIN